jgi:hypothetical protein
MIERLCNRSGIKGRIDGEYVARLRTGGIREALLSALVKYDCPLTGFPQFVDLASQT